MCAWALRFSENGDDFTTETQSHREEHKVNQSELGKTISSVSL